MSRFVRPVTLVLVGLLMTLAPLPVPADDAAAPDLLLILDASGSMWGQIEGENKIVIARRVLKELLGELPEGSEVGLVAYGHRREGDCDDIETIAAVAPLDRAALTAKVEALNPKGKTPITKAVNQAFDAVRDRSGPTTVLLVSDGIETCGGDPCQAVRDAKAAGVEFVMHVVGFDVAEEDVSQLECAAQAGGGLYLDADNADELGAALDQAVTQAEDIPDGRLSIKAIADGELTDVSIHVSDAATGEEVAGGRTYTSPDTNPRELPLADGTYHVKVQAAGMKGKIHRTFEGVVIADGSRVEKVVDFSTGELAVEVTRNGELSDATLSVVVAGTGEEVAGGRTYTRANSNPAVFRITVGEYDVGIRGIEISGTPVHRFEGVTVEAGGRAERSHDFKSGTLKLGAVAGAELVDATLRVYSVDQDQAVGQGRTYVSDRTNPKTFELTPGKYRLRVKAVKLEGDPSKELEVTIEAGETVERMVDFSQ